MKKPIFAIDAIPMQNNRISVGFYRRGGGVKTFSVSPARYTALAEMIIELMFTNPSRYRLRPTCTVPGWNLSIHDASVS